MKTELVVGNEVRLMANRGEIITRILVYDHGEVVSVCRPEEYRTSIVESRIPVSVGFPKKCIISEEKVSTDC